MGNGDTETKRQAGTEVKMQTEPGNATEVEIQAFTQTGMRTGIATGRQ